MAEGNGVGRIGHCLIPDGRSIGHIHRGLIACCKAKHSIRARTAPSQAYGIIPIGNRHHSPKHQGTVAIGYIIAPPTMVDQPPFAWLAVPPLTGGFFSRRFILAPPVTLECSPVALFCMPPLILDALPQASLSPPPLTLELSPIAWFFEPPLTLEYFHPRDWQHRR